LYVFSSHKKGISSHQLAKDITVTQKSAWFLLHRLRYAFDHPNFKAEMNDIVEIDESFFGGDAGNKHTNKKTKNEIGNTISDKVPVLGMMERGKFNLIERPHEVIKDKTVIEKIITRQSTISCVVVPSRHKEIILPIIQEAVKYNSTIMTDEYSAYDDLKNDYNHKTVNHGAKEYVNEMAHTNGIENFWSHLKRGIDGIYHWVSVEHLQSYCDEFTLRFNTRSFGTQKRFDFILAAVSNTRLTYKDLIK
jgi:transposase-like protein